MRQKILITSALPYANGSLHFGHLAGAYLPADIYARFERLRGKEVLFICGSDEYGVAVTLTAELNKRTPKEHTEIYYQEHKQFFEKLGISFDYFGRTTAPSHAPVVQRFFLDLLANGYIEARETEQLYSKEENRFLADRYVVGTCPRCGFEEARGDECGKCGATFEATDLIKPRSKITGQPLSGKKTTHYFLLFDRFKEKLSHFLKSKTWRANVINFAEPYLKEIRARAITRDLEWGVPVPLSDAKGKVLYVWFDAPIGYISITQEWAKKKGDNDVWKAFWLDSKTKYVQFLGKDNIPFHALFFPAMIMGQNEPYKQVDDLVASEFYNLEGRQFSKSEGWTIDLEDVFKRYQVDQMRYAVTATLPEGSDSEFTWKEFQLRCNAELSGKFGNLIHRVLVFVQNNCGGKIPKAGELQEADLRFENTMRRLELEIEEEYSAYRLRKVSQLIMELAQEGNAYFDAKAPWKDCKEEARRPFMETTIALCLELIKKMAILSCPIIPTSAQKIWESLGMKTLIENEVWKEALERPLTPHLPLPKPVPLFQKIEDEVIQLEIDKLQKLHVGAMEKKTLFAPLKEEVTIDDFHKLDLRVGLITKAEKVEKSKKLLKLEVDLGMEKRTILSGISEHYSAEELVGKKVIAIANLKPIKLMGIESQGMLLAGTIDSNLELLTVTDLQAGAQVS